MTAASFDSSYEYSSALGIQIARRELRTKYRGLLISLAVVVAWALFLLRDKEFHWLSGFLVGFVVALVVMLVKGYRTAVGRAVMYSGVIVSVHFDAQGIRLASAVLTSECPWQTISQVRRIPEGLLLVRRGSSQTVTIPHQALSPEAIAFLTSSVAAAGGRVEQNG